MIEPRCFRAAAVLTLGFAATIWSPIGLTQDACEMDSEADLHSVLARQSLFAAFQQQLDAMLKAMSPIENSRTKQREFRSMYMDMKVAFRHKDRLSYLRTLPKGADVDGAGQSLTGEPLSNPMSCHGVVLDSGNKVHMETDFESSGEMPLTLIRGYNKAAGSGIFGSRWSSSFDYSVGYSPYSTSLMCSVWGSETDRVPDECTNPTGPPKFYLYRPGMGQITLESAAPGEFADEKSIMRARELKDAQGQRIGWEVRAEDDRIETYDADGKPITLLNKHGIGWTYTYNAGTPRTIHRITHTSGRYVELGWSGTRLDSLRDPNSGMHYYTYVAHTVTGALHLKTATLPNGETRTYHYELSGTLQHALTGVSMNGQRYSTYEYYPDVGDPGLDPDDPTEYQDGRVKATSVDGGKERMTFAYSLDSAAPYTQRTFVTNARGETWNYAFGPYALTKRLESVSGPGANACPGTAAAIGYGAYGDPSVFTDWNGNTTTLTYDRSNG